MRLAPWHLLAVIGATVLAESMATCQAQPGAADAGSPGAVQPAPPPPQVAPGTPARVGLGTPRQPQLTDAQAARFSRQRVLAAAGPLAAPVHDGWDPLADAVITGDTPPPQWHYQVDPALADGHHVFATVQAALQKAHTDALAGMHRNKTRIYIGVAPGTYTEAPVVPPSPVPLTLWGLGDAPDAVRIQHNLYSQMSGTYYAARLASVADDPTADADIRAPHDACRQRARIGTDCAVVMRVRNVGFQLRNLTVANRYGQDQPGNLHQAVALTTDGADRVHLERVHLLGHQDTLFLRNPAPDRLARVFVHRSLVAGDVDFIFGDAVAYFHRSEIRWVGGLRGARSGFITAASTTLDAPYGLVFDDCDFTSDGLGLAARRAVHLGRQWFYGARCSPYGAGAAQCLPEPAAASAAGDPGPTAGAGAAAALAPSGPSATAGPLPAGTPARVSAQALRAVGKVAVLRSRLHAHIHPSEPWAPWNRAPDSPAYRPAQYDSHDFWRLLAEADHDASAWGWAPPPEPEPWLAEYRNRRMPGHARQGDNAW